MAKSETKPYIERAYQLLPHLIECAKAGRPITYSELAEKIGYSDRALSYPLGYIRDECLRLNLPLLNTLAVDKQKGLPSREYFAFDVSGADDDGFREIAKEYWATLPRVQGWEKLLEPGMEE